MNWPLIGLPHRSLISPVCTLLAIADYVLIPACQRYCASDGTRTRNRSAVAKLLFRLSYAGYRYKNAFNAEIGSGLRWAGKVALTTTNLNAESVVCSLPFVLCCLPHSGLSCVIGGIGFNPLPPAHVSEREDHSSPSTSSDRTINMVHQNVYSVK